MKRVVCSLSALLLAAAPAFAQKRLTCGTVDSLEVTSLTRTKATAFLRTTLPGLAAPDRRFSSKGRSSSRTRCCRSGQPVMALVQHSEGSHEVGLPRRARAREGARRPAREDCTPPRSISRSKEISGPPPARRRTPCAPPASFASGRRTSGAVSPVGQDFARFAGARFRERLSRRDAGRGDRGPLQPALVRSRRQGPHVRDPRRRTARSRPGSATASGSTRAARLRSTFPLVADNADLVAALAGAALAGGRVEGRLLATISVKVGKDQVMTVPLDLPGAIQVGP